MLRTTQHHSAVRRLPASTQAFIAQNTGSSAMGRVIRRILTFPGCIYASVSRIRVRIAILCIILLLPAVMLTFSLIENINTRSKQRFYNDVVLSQITSSTHLSQLFHDVVTTAEGLSVSSQVISRDNLQIMHLFREHYLNKEEFQVIVAVDYTGDIFSSSHGFVTTNDITQPPFFATYFQTGKAFILDDVVLDPTTHQPIVAVSAPIRDAFGRITGAVIIGVSLYKIHDRLERVVNQQSDSVILLNSKGEQIAFVGATLSGKAANIPLQVLFGGSTTYEYHDHRHTFFMSTGQVAETPFHLIFIRRHSSGIFLLDHVIVRAFSYFIGAVMISLFIAHKVSALISKPLDELRHHVVQISTTGKLDQVITQSNDHDIKMLTSAFNSLIRSIDERDKRLMLQHEKLQMYSAQLHNLLRTTMHAQEEERQRIALDLHDGVAQQVSGVHYHVQSALGFLRRGNKKTAYEALERAATELRSIMDEIHRVVYALRPPVLEKCGLGPALVELGRSYQTIPPRIQVSVTIHGEGENLSWEQQIALYRVAQECLNNSWKYAQGASVDVVLRCSADLVELSVSDTGNGFVLELMNSQQKPHIGLQGMRERIESLGGQFWVETSAGRGTRVVARLPRIWTDAEI